MFFFCFFVVMLVLMFFVLLVYVVDFIVISCDIQDGKVLLNVEVFNGFGCSGLNCLLQLFWFNVLVGIKSFVVIVYDLDVLIGSGWWYWIVFNLLVFIISLLVGIDVQGCGLFVGVIQGCIDFGSSGYGGVCLLVGDKLYCY